MGMKKMRNFKNNILSDQKKYEKLRKKANKELNILEEYFSKRQIDQREMYTDILKHLESIQKDLTYNGMRGISISLIIPIFVFIFNNDFLLKVFELKVKYFSEKIGIFIGTVVCTVIFFGIFYIAISPMYLADFKRRNQIYINEYMIKIIQEKINNKK